MRFRGSYGSGKGDGRASGGPAADGVPPWVAAKRMDCAEIEEAMAESAGRTELAGHRAILQSLDIDVPAVMFWRGALQGDIDFLVDWEPGVACSIRGFLASAELQDAVLRH